MMSFFMSSWDNSNYLLCPKHFKDQDQQNHCYPTSVAQAYLLLNKGIFKNRLQNILLLKAN